MKKICNPVFRAVLKAYPGGNIYQFFGENPELYRSAINIPNCGLLDCRMNGHNGIDIAMAEGTPILATAGIVVDVKDTPNGYGKHVRILTDPDENGDMWELTYGHLKDVNTALGMRVLDSQEIGTMGNTGFIISGRTPYWGNAPAGKGVHLHLTARVASTKDTGWETQYLSGQKAFIKDYDNGVFGAVDPEPSIRLWLEGQVAEKQNILIALLELLIEKLKGRLIG